MALQYDNFAINRVVVEANLWPPVQEIPASTLSNLFSEVNSDDIFATCELRPSGATFDGEVWDYTINRSTVVLRWWGHMVPNDLYVRIRRFLDGTRVVAMDHQVVFYTEEIRVFADIPEGKNRNVGDLVKKRLLKGMKAQDRDSLVGLASAGLSLVGGGDDFAYQAKIEPQLGKDVLNLFVGLKFRPGAEPPRPGPDLDLIESQTQIACRFTENDLVEFSRKLFT
ncbi:MAG: hypothetical protein WB507_09975 [Solirubrobacterales bacterium]